MTPSSQLLRAGYAQAVITPPVGFTIWGSEHPPRPAADVADDLLIRVLALQAGGVNAAVVTLDVWGISSSVEAAIVARVASQGGIEPAHVWVGVSGNASSPPLWDDSGDEYLAYAAYLPQQAGGVVALAVNRFRDAELGFAEACLPGLATSLAGRAQEIDEAVPVMIVNGADGPVARVFGFGCPGSVSGREPAVWTADYPGYACWALSQASGGAGCMFLRGPAADVRPFDWFAGNPAPAHPGRVAADVQAFGWLLATQAGVAAQGALPRRNVEISVIDGFESPGGAGALRALRVGEGVFASFARPLPSAFGAALRAALPGRTLFINGNLRGRGFDESAGPADFAAETRRLKALLTAA